MSLLNACLVDVAEAGPMQHESIIYDGFGPHPVPDVIDGSTYQLVGVHTPSAMPFVKNTKQHTGVQWLSFATHTTRAVRELGGKPTKSRFDMAGEFQSPEFRQSVEDKTDTNVELGPSKWHEAVGDAEVMNDILTRMAEAYLRRAQLGPRYLLAARKLASYVLRFRRKHDQTHSRLEHLRGTRPHMKHRDMMPFMFGCHVLVLRDKPDRGPHGSATNGRCFTGRYLGIEGRSHIVQKLDTNEIVYPSHVTPLNEAEMARASLPLSLTLRTMATQTMPTEFPALTTISPATIAVPSAVTAPVPTTTLREAYIVGERIEVQYDSTWFAGIVVSTKFDQPGSPNRTTYLIEWEDKRWDDDPTWKGRYVDIQCARGPDHRRAPLPSSPPTSILPGGIADGTNINLALVYGGDPDMLNGVLQQTSDRYPRSWVKVFDLLNGYDLTKRQTRVDLLAELKLFTCVIVATPCTTFCVRGEQYRSKDEIRGLKKIAPHLKRKLHDHNILTDFTITVLNYCENHNILWAVECTASRSEDNDAFWKKFAHWGFFWDLKPVKDLEKLSGGRFLIAMCKCGMEFQKYVMVMVCKRMASVAHEVFDDLWCDHAHHPSIIGGRDSHGNSIAQLSQVYTPEFARRMSRLACDTLVPVAQRAAIPPLRPDKDAAVTSCQPVCDPTMASPPPRSYCQCLQHTYTVTCEGCDEPLQRCSHCNRRLTFYCGCEGHPVYPQEAHAAMQLDIRPSAGTPITSATCPRPSASSIDLQNAYLQSEPGKDKTTYCLPPSGVGGAAESCFTLQSALWHDDSLTDALLQHKSMKFIDSIMIDQNDDRSSLIDVTIGDSMLKLAEEDPEVAAALLELYDDDAPKVGNNAALQLLQPEGCQAQRQSHPLDAFSLACVVCPLREQGYTCSAVADMINDAGDFVASLDDVRAVPYETFCLHRSFDNDVPTSLEALAADFDVCKATQNEVLVKTPLGPQVLRIPATKRELDAAPDREYWVESDRIGLESILNYGAKLRRLDEKPKGVPLAECVTHRKAKVDPSSSELDKRKSRHCVDGGRLAAFRRRLGLPSAPAGTINIIDDLALKLFLADLAGRGRRFLTADVKDAYAKGRRGDRPITWMRMPSTCQTYDEDGTPFVICLETMPLWGETEAGYEWELELHLFLLELGWKQCIGCPAMYYFDAPDSDARLVKIVDDIAFSESHPDAPITESTFTALIDKYKDVTIHRYPKSLAGYKIDHSADLKSLRISQPQKVLDAVMEHMPHLIHEPGSDKSLSGGKLEAALKALVLPTEPPPKKLSKDQQRFQSITGFLKFFERGSYPRLSKMVHCLSRVMSNPPPETCVACAEGVLAYAYAHLNEGLHFEYRADAPTREHHDGKMDIDLSAGAPNGFEITADASTTPDVYALLMTYMGASILHLTKNMGCAVANTQEGEQIATVRASEFGLYGRTVMRALGIPPEQPTIVVTDNLPNQRVSQNVQSSQRSRYFLIRYACLHQRIADGDFHVVFTHDPNNPSDFLTKLGLPSEKVEASVRYSTGNFVSRGKRI